MNNMASAVGMPPGVTGHEPQVSQRTGWYQARCVDLSCTCGGFRYTARLKKDDHVDGYGMRAWRQHVENAQAPDEIIPIGKVTKTRTEWDVFVFPRTYAGAADWNAGQYRGWHASEGYGSAGWAVGVKKPSGQRLAAITNTKVDAIKKAHDLLETEENRGFRVDRAVDDPRVMSAAPLSPQSSIVHILTKVDDVLDTGKLAAVEAVLGEVNELLSVTDILRDRQKVLTEKREQLATAKLLA